MLPRPWAATVPVGCTWSCLSTRSVGPRPHGCHDDGGAEPPVRCQPLHCQLALLGSTQHVLHSNAGKNADSVQGGFQKTLATTHVLSLDGRQMHLSYFVDVTNLRFLKHQIFVRLTAALSMTVHVILKPLGGDLCKNSPEWCNTAGRMSSAANAVLCAIVLVVILSTLVMENVLCNEWALIYMYLPTCN